MRWLISTALRVRFIVVALAILLMAFGSRLISDMPLDVFPEFAPPKVEIQTEVPGLSAAEVEALVTVPIESAMNGIPWLDKIRSKTVMGLSSVKLLFETGTDLIRARQLVQERLAQVANRLPAVSRPPVILSPLSSTSRVMKIGMQSEQMDQMEMTTLALWTIRPRLMALQGVANVAIWGQRDRQFQVQIDPERLHAHGVTMQEVIDAARRATELSGGSFVESDNQRFNVTHANAIQTADDLAKTPLRMVQSSMLTLGDVATVVVASPPPIGDGIIDDKPGLLLIVEKQPWGNTLDVTQRVEKALRDLAPALDGVRVDPTIFRPATYIENSIDNLNSALLIGCLLVVVVLTAFLWNLRTAMISLVAIPISLLTAGLVLHAMGSNINTMVLAGLIIALGEVVDDAIIDVENIVRRLRLNADAAHPLSSFSVILHASLEVRSAVVLGTLIVILVLIPVFMLGGLTGTFFQPLALSYVIAIGASLLVALIVTPALSLILLPNGIKRFQEESALVSRLKALYRPLLSALIHRPKTGVIVLLAALATAGVIYPQMGQQLLPNFKEYNFLMHWLERPGTSIDAMNRVTIRASKELRAIDGIRNFGAHVGRAEVADEVVGVDFTELWISMDPKVDYEATIAKAQAVVDGYPGLYRDLLTYLRERIKEVLTGGSGNIVIRIFGPDLDQLQAKAQEVADELRGIEGISKLHVQQQKLIPQIELHYRNDAVQTFGLNVGDLRRMTQTILSGDKVGEVYDQQKIFDVVVRGEPKFGRDIDSVKRLPVELPSGGTIPLDQLADIYIAPTPNNITREAGSRKIDIAINVSGRSLSAVANDVAAKLRQVTFDSGYYPEQLGEFAALEEASRTLWIVTLFALLGIYLILQANFHSNRLALLIFISLPAALVGGVLGALLDGGVLSLGSLIGFITVLGISARNGIMLISHYRHLQQQESMPFGIELVMRGSEERLAPILMTALTTGLALLPLILGGNSPGHEIEQPMAVVILGGLISSALINLLIVPGIYLKYGNVAKLEKA